MKRSVLVWLPIILTLTLVGCSSVNTEQDRMDAFVKETEIPPQERADFFIAIHCEPGAVPVSTDYVQRNWTALTRMVQSASEHNIHLTLLLNPQWAMYILENPERRDLVRLWERYGHEIGLHHHGPHMDNWNGYTNQVLYFDSPKYVGSIDEMMVLINMIPLSGQIKTACVSSEDAETDFPQGVLYETNGGSNKTEDLWSTPTELIRNGEKVIQVTHARYAARGSKVDIDLEEMKLILSENESDEVAGLVFHPFEYAENPPPFNALFSLLDDNGIYTRTVAATIEDYQ